jgi:hypothetical protein
MRVVKVAAARRQWVVHATGRVSAVYAAVTDDGEEVARFRPVGAAGYSARSDSWVRDVSGRKLQGPVPSHTLAQFRAWVASGLEGAYVYF